MKRILLASVIGVSLFGVSVSTLAHTDPKEEAWIKICKQKKAAEAADEANKGRARRICGHHVH